VPNAAFDIDRAYIVAPRHDGVFPIGNSAVFVLGLLGRPGSRMRVKGELVAAPHEGRNTAEFMRESLSRIAGVPALGIGAPQKLDFARFYDNVTA